MVSTRTPLLDDFHARRVTFGPLTIPDGEYFLLGDNRDFSHDSRFRGTVHGAWIVGRPLYLYWSKDRSRIGRTVR